MSGLFYVWLKLEHECHKENWRNHNNNNKMERMYFGMQNACLTCPIFVFCFCGRIFVFFYEKEITFLNGFLTFFTYT